MRIAIGMLIAALAIPLTVQTTDQSRPVLDVIVVDVNVDLDGFLDRMKRIEQIARRLDLRAK